MTVEAIAAEAKAQGFRVRNLFERESDGLWQANLCDAKTGEGFIFAHGDTMAEALERALRLSAGERKAAQPEGIFG